MIPASCHVLFELTEKLALGIRLHPTPFQTMHVYLGVPQGLCSADSCPSPTLCQEREDSSPEEFKYCAFERSWKGTISNGGGYCCFM